MIDPKSLRIGNTVTIENPKYWPELKGIPMTVIGYNATNDSGWPKSTASISVVDFNEHPIMYHQFNEFITGIPLSEQELIRLGFENVGGCGSFRWQTDEYMLERWITTSNWCFRLRVDPKTSYEMAKVQFLHELQNLYYSLTGTELTYKPENETIKP